jgi:D-alanine--poly(phosphoribitol) ligase subunit 1
VDTVLATPTLLSKMDPSAHTNLKLIVTGGEALSLPLAAKWIHQGALVVNAFGPTEITMVLHHLLILNRRALFRT